MITPDSKHSFLRQHAKNLGGNPQGVVEFAAIVLHRDPRGHLNNLRFVKMGSQCHEKLIFHSQIRTRHAFTIFERNEARERVLKATDVLRRWIRSEDELLREMATRMDGG